MVSCFYLMQHLTFDFAWAAVQRVLTIIDASGVLLQLLQSCPMHAALYCTIMVCIDCKGKDCTLAESRNALLHSQFLHLMALIGFNVHVTLQYSIRVHAYAYLSLVSRCRP